MYMSIETKNGIYKIKKPTGRIGAMHFAVVTKALPKNSETDKDGNFVMSPSDEDRLYKGFEEWANKVLKAIVDEKESVYKFDDMPGEDQWAIFMALVTNIQVDEGELFRIL